MSEQTKTIFEASSSPIREPSRDPLPPLLSSSPRIGWPRDAKSAAAPNRDTVRSSTSNSVPRLGAIAVSALRFEHIDAAVNGIIEDKLSSKTIHNTVTLLRTMLAGKRGPSAVRRGFAFHDPTMGLELPPLESRQITPPTPEQVWALIGAAKEPGGF